MSIKESALTAITSITQSDFIRAVTSAGASRRVKVANLAKAIIESYTGSSLAGESQSVKTALDSLNSKTVTYKTLPTINLSSLTWSQSTSGKYYLADENAIDMGLPDGAIPLGFLQVSFNNLSANAVIEPYLRASGKLGLLSNTNSFSEQASIGYRAIYRP